MMAKTNRIYSHVAEGIGIGLQNLLRRFDSAHGVSHFAKAVIVRGGWHFYASP